MHTLRPKDSDAVLSALRRARNDTGVPMVFAGEADGETARLTRFIGARTDSMQGLAVAKGRGLGGHVMATGRPATVRDYEECSGITRDYADAVEREGLRAIISVPVMVSGVARTILYGSARVATQLGDQVAKTFTSVAAELAAEFQVRDEVDRRLRMADLAVAEQGGGLETADREQLRVLHGELRAIAAELGDPALRDRLLAAGSALAGVGRSPASGESPVPARVVLSPREIDVLAQVALGCSNAEVGARLSLSPETIKAYLRNIGTKLGTRSRMESVARARLLGVLP
ncbi:LuxR C-terminal-related transcriptional regulator [Dietzia sp. UBA5065]|jgi:DNA-binding CsgD family transcriptional regulator|uniref:LuxR C-terminal-related transcriptional regulator n=1 Tax=Dietzia sp. UBA5065 TaxID=1946422 RepID=UPI0025BB1D8E|nr:LuxR C-terminal-related transcriptional regulator [Dietzia sp. UBA5065]HMT49059.1 LuxR C-terminal-related transcriptional regulator [Dietzia sp.]